MNTNSGFVKNHSMLMEDHRVEDLLDFSEQAASFERKISTINTPSIIALVGKFGSGKSTMLYQLEQRKTDNVKWINFDAWKYPDRKDLWEGLILDFAEQVGEKAKKKVKNRIDGKDTKSKILDVGTDILGTIATSLPKLDFLEKFTEIFKQSPAKRVFEIQKLFEDLINSLDSESIIITVEDIDRSGDAGTFFLETFKQFIKTINTEKKLLVIVPVGDQNYQRHIDSYLKCIDYVEFFDPKPSSMLRFVEEAFADEYFAGEQRTPDGRQITWSGTNRKTQLASFFEALFLKESKMTMRLLKIIIRKANIIFQNQSEDGLEPDLRVTICIEASKYFSYNGNEGTTWFNHFEVNNKIPSNSIYASFLVSMLQNRETLFNNYDPSKAQELVPSSYDFRFIERKGANPMNDFPSTPWDYSSVFNDKSGYGLCSFYLKY